MVKERMDLLELYYGRYHRIQIKHLAIKLLKGGIINFDEVADRGTSIGKPKH